MALDNELLKILVCPQCHGAVRWDEKIGGLICDNCKLLYEVKNDIPVMLVDEARKIT